MFEIIRRAATKARRHLILLSRRHRLRATPTMFSTGTYACPEQPSTVPWAPTRPEPVSWTDDIDFVRPYVLAAREPAHRLTLPSRPNTLLMEAS